MRVRLNTPTKIRPGLRKRGVHPPRPAEAPADPASCEVRALREERRVRASGGPQDHATYHCACGYVFEARVSTTVDCPHCGNGQAW